MKRFLNKNSQRNQDNTNAEHSRARVSKVTAGLAGVALASTTVLGVVGAKDMASQNRKIVSLEENKINVAQTEVLAQQEAAQQAAAYTEAFGSGSPMVPMLVLNGQIESPITPLLNGQKGGGPSPVYKNPILLSTINPSAKPGKNGNFLAGGWFGVQSNGANGKVIITAVPFEAGNDTFVPYGSNIILSTSAYAEPTKGGPGFNDYGLYAYDPQAHRSLQNPDGTAVTPGLLIPAQLQ
ncbi:MAG TPA: hypothetical protein VNE40_04695 [Candidatus Dormibacteraeota bacterium]|nr:hypothetical protein [Candidatus Dormibacteraeota bacterium]